MASLGAALREVAAAMRAAEDPWWIIGSAAVYLHGIDTPVADVDLLCTERDASRLCAAWNIVPGPPSDDGLFRSAVFARLDRAPMPIEVMGDLMIRRAAEWSPLCLTTRHPVTMDGATVHVPSREELVAVLRLFGRDKDLRRAALLLECGRNA